MGGLLRLSKNSSNRWSGFFSQEIHLWGLGSFLGSLGRALVEWVQTIGQIILFLMESTKQGFQIQGWAKRILSHLGSMVFFSLGLIFLTSIFCGMVLALQIYINFQQMGSGATQAIPSIIALAVTRELGPVLGGLMMAARLGSSMAAEIGTMKVSEQLEALITLSRPPLGYVIFPKIFASMMALPLLILVGDVAGILGGYITIVSGFSGNSGVYIAQTLQSLEIWDIAAGMIKGLIFGLLIALISCYQGIRAKKGALGVGISTMGAVVQSCAVLLLCNYLLSALLFS
jgi:phospholipid/cholesterol/gamma-HCH transport system permease protein